MLLAITPTGKVVLLLTAATFIGFALVSAMVVPRWRPGFPGDRLPLFVMACALLLGAQIAAVAWVTGTQEVKEKAAAAPTSATQTAPTATTPATNATAVAKGKTVFQRNGCAACHTLSAVVGATGAVGPNLDHLAADAKNANRGSLAHYVQESIVSPNAYIRPGFPPSVMPQTFGQLPKDQLDALVQFLISASAAKSP
jgi:cytochrome c551/c552